MTSKKRKKTEEKLDLEEIIVSDKTEEIEKKEEIKEPEVIESKPSVIKKGSKIIVSGRTFGNSLLECPITSVKDYSAKILEIENGNYLIDKGWISSTSIKD